MCRYSKIFSPKIISSLPIIRCFATILTYRYKKVQPEGWTIICKKNQLIGEELPVFDLVVREAVLHEGDEDLDQA